MLKFENIMLFFFLTCLVYKPMAQTNLVINPDFEWFGATPDTFYSAQRGKMKRSSLGLQCSIPFESGIYSPLNSYNGSVYKLIILKQEVNVNEYSIINLQAGFCKDLVKDSLYQVSLYIKPGKGNYVARFINVLFVDSAKATFLFGDNRVKEIGNKIRSIAHKQVELSNDKIQYQKIEFDYKAIGGERYLYLGNAPTMQDEDFIKSEYGGYNDPNKRQLVSYAIDMVSVVPYSKAEDCGTEVVWNNPYPSVLSISLQEQDRSHIVLDTVGMETNMNANRSRWDFILGEIGKYTLQDTLEVRWHAFDSGEFGDLTLIGAQRAKEIFMFLSGRLKRNILFEGRYVPLSITGDKRTKMFGTTQIIIRPQKRSGTLQPATQTTVLDTIHYDTNLDESNYKLGNLVNRLLEFSPSDTVFVIGYTDSIGSISYNQKLSLSRAQKVAGFLNGRIKNIVIALGKGFSNPIDRKSNSANNRRTEIVVKPYREKNE